MIYNNNTDDIIKIIKHIMVDNNIKNVDIQKATNKSKQTISNFFNGRQSNVTLDTLKDYCDAIDCDLVIDIVKR